MKNRKHVIIIRPVDDTLMGSTLALPLGSLYLAESLIDSGYTVSIIDTNNKRLHSSIDPIINEDTICFGISTMSGSQLANAILIADALKLRYPKLPIIWGGVHVTILPEQTLQSNLVDYIIWGEGEKTFPALLNAIINNDSLYSIKGVGFKNGDNIFVGENSGHTSLKEMNDLPYHLLDMDRYARKLIIGAKREFTVLTARGCPFKCRFCINSSTHWPNTKMRYHTIDYVVNNVKILVTKYGADMISFGDECCLMDEKRFLEILDAILKEGIFVKYRFTARVDLLLRLKEETWEKLKEYGVVAIGIAPESGSQKILDYMAKKITVEQIYKVNDILTKFNFYKTYNLLICSPHETTNDLKQTLKLVSEFAPTAITSPYPFGSFNKYMPLPGTELYEDAIKCGLKPPEKLEEWSNFEFERNKIDTKEIVDIRSTVRPWIVKKDFDYINRACYLVKKLNALYSGLNTDLQAVKEVTNEIDKMIAKD